MSMFKQRHRKKCLAAIKEAYGEVTVELMSDRLGLVYWSIWRFGDNLLETIEYKDRIEIGMYRPTGLKEENIFIK